MNQQEKILLLRQPHVMGVVEEIHPDESAYWLFEINLTPFIASRKGYKPPSMAGRKRYQIIQVNRGDHLVNHYTDLGDSALFSGPFELPSLWEHSVAELRDMADTMRWRDEWTKDLITNLEGESTLLKDTAHWLEERQQIKATRSHFGPGYSRQRNVYRRNHANKEG